MDKDLIIIDNEHLSGLIILEGRLLEFKDVIDYSHWKPFIELIEQVENSGIDYYYDLDKGILILPVTTPKYYFISGKIKDIPYSFPIENTIITGLEMNNHHITIKPLTDLSCDYFKQNFMIISSNDPIN